MKTFSDIDNFPWAKEAIEEVATKGILQEVLRILSLQKSIPPGVNL